MNDNDLEYSIIAVWVGIGLLSAVVFLLGVLVGAASILFRS